MRINELIVENQQIDELSLAGALGSAAKGAANVVGRAKGAWAGAQDVYNQQSGRVAKVAQRNVQRAGGYKKPAAANATPAPAATGTPTTAPAPSTGTPTTAPATTAPAAPTTAPTTGTPTPAPTPTAAPAQWPAGVPKFNSVTGQKFASPEEAEQVTNSPEFKQQMADIAAGKDPSSVQATQQQSAPASTEPTTTPAPNAAPAAEPTRANTRVPVNIAKQDVDQAVNSVTKVRSRDRQNVVKYAKDKIDALQTAPAPAVESVIYSKFLGQMI